MKHEVTAEWRCQAQDRSLLQLSRWTLLDTGSPDIPNSDQISLMGPHRPCFLLNAQSRLSRGLKNSQGTMQPQEPKASQSPLDQSIPPNQHLYLDPSPQLPAQQCGPSPSSLAGLLTNQACSPAWPSLQRRTKSISVSHKSCLTQAPGIAPKVLLGGISTPRHGQAPTSFTMSASTVRAPHPFSLCTTSFSHCLPLSSCLAHCGLSSIQNSNWTFSDIWQSCEGRTVRGLAL